LSGRRIIFAGPARDVAPFLEGVTRNIEAFATRFAAWAVVMVENDSRDDSKARLRAWMEKARGLGAVRAVLIDMDGLAAQTERTNRIAAARNRILQEIEQDAELSRFDLLAMMDMDIPNSYPARPEKFAAAAGFLEDHEDVAAVFPNQLPLYYDLWTLREKNWCPGDCWDEVAAAAPSLGAEAAIAKYVYDRQIYLDPARPPLEVDSAFGGIGIYRLSAVLGRRYAGLKPDGTAASDHVALHETIRREGGRFFILPGFLNLTSFEHTLLAKTHILLPMRGTQLHILIARDSNFAQQRGHYPAFGERFAALASLYGRGDAGAILDLGAHAGESLVLARLHGCASPYICVEGRELEFAVLCANALMHDALFADHQMLRVVPSFDKAPGLVRLATGNDAPLLLGDPAYLRGKPLLWARIEGPQEADAWGQALQDLPYDEVMVFNALGVMIAAGPLAEQKQKLAALFPRLPRSAGGLDLAFFGPDARDLFQEFRAG
jgi:hypothetical protein